MEFVSGLALVLLTMVGYSSGAVLVGRQKHVVPGLFDLLMLIVLWVAALMTRSFFGKWWAIAVWLVIGLILGAAFTTTKLSGFPRQRGVTPAKNAWEAWKRFAEKMSDYQSRALLLIFYFLVVTPFGLVVSLFSDPLRVKRPVMGSFWLKRTTPDSTLEGMHKQS